MYAIVEVGGKQVSIKKGDVIEVEKQDAQAGSVIVLKNVLLIKGDDDVVIGSPYVAGAAVEASVEAQFKGAEMVAFKYRRRKASHTTRGHRQKLTRLKITDIKVK
jgi:large subunit ribosomal protein L21